MRGKWGMGVDLFGPGAKLPPGGGVELAGVRQWVKSLLALPVLFVLVVVVCALAGLKNWLVVLIAMSSLTVIFEALLLRGGAPSLVVSPAAVVRRTRWRTTTVRAADVSDVLVRHTVNGPIMVISSGNTKVGLSLPSAFRKPMGRNVLASFLRRAGVDLPSLRGLGLPVPVDPPRAVAGPILSRPAWPGPGSASPASGTVPWSQAGEWPVAPRSYDYRTTGAEPAGLEPTGLELTVLALTGLALMGVAGARRWRCGAKDGRWPGSVSSRWPSRPPSACSAHFRSCLDGFPVPEPGCATRATAAPVCTGSVGQPGFMPASGGRAAR